MTNNDLVERRKLGLYIPECNHREKHYANAQNQNADCLMMMTSPFPRSKRCLTASELCHAISLGQLAPSCRLSENAHRNRKLVDGTRKGAIFRNLSHAS